MLCNALLETWIRDLRQDILSASRSQNIVKGKFHAKRDEFVVVFCFLPDIWGHKCGRETERFVGKAEWSWTVIANEKLLQEFSSQNKKMIEETKETFSKFIDDLSGRKEISLISDSFWEIWSSLPVVFVDSFYFIVAWCNCLHDEIVECIDGFYFDPFRERHHDSKGKVNEFFKAKLGFVIQHSLCKGHKRVWQMLATSELMWRKFLGFEVHLATANNFWNR